MSFGIGGLKQYIVEFISDATIGGIWTNGLRNNTQGTSGPYTWTVPDGVCLLKVDGISGGSGGGGGYNTGTSLAGGAGGSSGGGMIGMDLHVIPNAVLTITLGAGGNGGAPGNYGSGPGRSSISGLTRPYLWRRYFNGTTDSVEFSTGYGVGGGDPGFSDRGGSGGFVGNAIVGFAGGSTNAVSTPSANSSYIGNYMTGADSYLNRGSNTLHGGRVVCQGGAGGGGASTVGSTAGGGGGGNGAGGSIYNAYFGIPGSASGNTTGTISRGGGGIGGNSFLSSGGAGGAGGSPGSDGSFGSGGGGGGGGAAGGKGGNGYIKFTYWRMD